jgi:Calcineurin-like phosphoesterase
VLVKLYAISDLHVGYEANRKEWQTLRAHPGDWLILGGDLGETEEHLRVVLEIAVTRFAKVFWVPGNHELWTLPARTSGPAGSSGTWGDRLRGEARYLRWVAVCREYGVLTPEDPFAVWPGEGEQTVVAPLHVLYDYSFCPEGMNVEEALEWARAAGLECTDELLLHPDPYPTRQAWCQARVEVSRRRLAEVPSDHRTVLVNHFPLKRELARLPAIPRFSIWCGTRLTETWHQEYRARVVVSGHLHIRSTRWIDGVRFEEVSMGYPRQRPSGISLEGLLREILPGPAALTRSA